jgi:hypothetical protein
VPSAEAAAIAIISRRNMPISKTALVADKVYCD